MNHLHLTCRRGHPFTPENTYTYPVKGKHYGVRICRQCRRDREKHLHPSNQIKTGFWGEWKARTGEKTGSRAYHRDWERESRRLQRLHKALTEGGLKDGSDFTLLGS